MLNLKQQRFIEEYLRDFNATQAAVRVGYSEKTAYSHGARLLKDVEISEAIKLKLSETAMSADEVIRRLGDMARADIASLMDITPSGYTIKLTTKDEQGNIITNPNTKLIKKIKQKVTTFLSKQEDGEDREIIETELELYSAQEALALLGKHHGLFVDRTELTGADGREFMPITRIEIILPAEDKSE